MNSVLRVKVTSGSSRQAVLASQNSEFGPQPACCDAPLEHPGPGIHGEAQPTSS